MQDAVIMYPSQLAFYKRPCLRDGCKGTQTITKTLGHHVIIETVMDMSHPHRVIVHFAKWTTFLSISQNGTVVSPLRVIPQYG